MAGVGSKWQGVGTSGMGCWQGVGACSRGQRYVVWVRPMACMGICGKGWGLVVGCGACGRLLGHLAGVVEGCGVMWQGWGYVVGVMPMPWMGHVAGVGACGKM